MKKIEKIFLFLLATFIALSPSFSAGKIEGGKIIEIRGEDILLVVFIPLWFFQIIFSKEKIERKPLFFPIIIWVILGIFSTVFNIILGRLNFFRGLFYSLKEIEIFLIYFFVVSCLKDKKEIKNLVYLWFVLGAFNLSYVLYQIFTQTKKGEYGVAAICEKGVFPTGLFFLLLFIFFYNHFVYYFSNKKISFSKKSFLFLISTLPALAVFTSASRSNSLALFLSFISILFLAFFKERKKKVFILFLITFPLLYFYFRFSLTPFPSSRRISDLTNPKKLIYGLKKGRLETAIKPEFERAILHPSLIGFGKGFVQEAHNQFLRNFIETGFLGSLAFLFLIFAIIKKAWQKFKKEEDSISISLSSNLLVAIFTLLFLSLVTEAFLVVKPAEVFWFFVALTFANY